MKREAVPAAGVKEMFGRLAHVRLRTAEQALHDGRVDDALEIVAAPDLAGQRRTEKLRGDLFEALLDRAQKHLMDHRHREALADLDKAARCGVQADKLAEWRDRAVAAMQRYGRREREQKQALDAAARNLDQGALTLAGDCIDRLPDHSPDKRRMSEEAADKAERARRAAEDARGALEAEQYTIAVERLLAARRDHAGAPLVVQTIDAAVARLAQRIREAVTAGRLDQAQHDMALARRLDADRPDLAELNRAVGWIERIGSAVSDARYDDALMLTAKLSQMFGKARWVGDVREQLEAIKRGLSELARGPLGLLESGPGVAGEPDRPAAAETIANRARPAARAVAAGPIEAPPMVEPSGMPRRLILRVDGSGSYLLLRGERIVIGRNGPLADLPIMADLSERHAEVFRAGDDYFIIGSTGVELAGHPVRQALLNHGDRVQLNRRVRLSFERPSRKSPTAMLKLGEGVRSVADVRRAILWSGPILLGASSECHIPLRGASGLVLIDRGGEAQLRPMPGRGDAPALSGPLTLPLDRPVKVGDVQISLNSAMDLSLA